MRFEFLEKFGELLFIADVCRGSVEFGLSSPMTGWYENSGMELFARGQMASSGVSFYDIEDPRGVADLVERLRDEVHVGRRSTPTAQRRSAAST